MRLRPETFRNWWTSAIAAVCAALVLCAAAMVFAMQLWRADLRVPLYAWTGDRLLYASSRDGLLMSMPIKGTIEHGGWLRNPQLGAPFGQRLYDYPFWDNDTMFMVKVISAFTSSYAVAINVVFLVGFPLIVLAALFVLRAFKISYPCALVISLLYALAP